MFVEDFGAAHEFPVLAELSMQLLEQTENLVDLRGVGVHVPVFLRRQRVKDGQLIEDGDGFDEGSELQGIYLYCLGSMMVDWMRKSEE